MTDPRLLKDRERDDVAGVCNVMALEGTSLEQPRGAIDVGRAVGAEPDTRPREHPQIGGDVKMHDRHQE
jgi:hypothetical protein